MHTNNRIFVATCCSALALAGLVAQQATAATVRPGAGAHTAAGSTAAVADSGWSSTSPAVLAQSARLQPLRAIADALGEQGRGAFSGIYSNLYIDQANDRVTLYVTDTAHAAQLVRAAAHAHPGIDTARIRIVHALYTFAALDAAARKIVAANAVGTAQLTVYSAAPAGDGSGIRVTANSAASAHANAMTALAGGIPVTVSPGTPITPSSWRWDDHIPFIGGDVLLGSSRLSGRENQCTAGLAAESSSGRDYLITAAHCYPAGAGVYGEGDPIGTFNFNTGNFFGNVAVVQDKWDAESIDTGLYGGNGTNSDEADQPTGKWYKVTSYAYSYNGDTVCQDGAKSYYDGRGVPCGILVNQQDVYYNITWDDGSVHQVRGVGGTGSYTGGPGYTATEGDSGALVFTISGSSTRQARGQESATQNYGQNMYWTEATDILGSLGMTLNPHQ